MLKLNYECAVKRFINPLKDMGSNGEHPERIKFIFSPYGHLCQGYPDVVIKYKKFEKRRSNDETGLALDTHVYHVGNVGEPTWVR